MKEFVKTGTILEVLEHFRCSICKLSDSLREVVENIATTHSAS
jgi:hypothetical protein